LNDFAQSYARSKPVVNQKRSDEATKHVGQVRTAREPN
jgi:hypothetical protein